MNKYQVAIIDTKRPPAELTKAAKKNTFEWGEVIGNYKVYPCHTAQLDILKSKAKFTFAFAGSGGGKTVMLALWVFKQMQKNPSGRCLIVSATDAIYIHSQLKQALLDTFEGTHLEGVWQEKKKIYKLPNTYDKDNRLIKGGEIVIKTAEGDPKRVRGGHYDCAAADEVVVMSKDVFEEIRRRVSNKNGPVLGVTTPDTNNWIYEIKQLFDAGDKDYYVRYWSKIDNPSVSIEDVDRERKLLSPERFARMVEGKFASLEGLVYQCFSNEKFPQYPVIDADPYKLLRSPPVRFFAGNDWGYSPDPACFLMFAECEDGIIYAVDEIFGTEITPADYARRQRTLIDRWGMTQDEKYSQFLGGAFTQIWCDTSRPEHMALCKEYHISVRGNKVRDILAGIATVDSWFRAGRLKIYKNCTNLIREAKGYNWKKDRRGETRDEPNDKNNHAMDALRYGIASQKYGVKPDYIELEPAESTIAKIERYGFTEAEMKEKEQITAKERYEKWFWEKLNLEAGI